MKYLNCDYNLESCQSDRGKKDVMLTEAVKKQGGKNWKKVAESLTNRSSWKD